MKMDGRKTFQDYKNTRASSKEKGRKFYSCYWFKYNEQEGTIDFNWISRWGDDKGKATLTARMYPNGNVWFRPWMTLQNQYLYVGEANLLAKLVPVYMQRETNQYASGVWYSNLGYYERRKIPTHARKVSADWVLLNSDGDVLEHAEPLRRVIKEDERKALLEKLDRIRKDTTLRAKIGALKPSLNPPFYTQYSRYFHYNSKEVEKLIDDVDINDITTFQGIFDLAISRYGTRTSWTQGKGTETITVPPDECLKRTFAALRKKLLHTKQIVSYA